MPGFSSHDWCSTLNISPAGWAVNGKECAPKYVSIPFSTLEWNLDHHALKILAGLEVLAQDAPTAAGPRRLDDQCVPDRDRETAAGFDGSPYEFGIGRDHRQRAQLVDDLPRSGLSPRGVNCTPIHCECRIEIAKW